MRRITPDGYRYYLEDDWVLDELKTLSHQADTSLQSQRWLLESGPKRMVFSMIYEDLLFGELKRQRVLDIGGGLTSLTRLLLKRHNYEIVQLATHDHDLSRIIFEKEHRSPFITIGDWRDVSFEDYDLVIANDVFPNVDQGLQAFMNLAKDSCVRLRISLTWHTSPKHYRLQRANSEEVLTMVAWSPHQLVDCLAPYANSIWNYSEDVILSPSSSIFSNQRQVAVLEADFHCLG